MSDATDALVTACQALTEAIRGSALDPADAISMLAQFIAYAPVQDSPDANTQAAQTATASMMRRCAFTSLALACAAYNPTSSTDALSVRALVVPLFDAEITVAADAGDRDAYRTLRALRSAVSTDLVTRAANLPAIITVTTRQAEPTLVVAWRLYGNTMREPGMTARADVIHPLFMPTLFEALSA